MLTITSYLNVARQAARPSTLRASAPSRYGAGARAPVVVWNLTERCNQACAHCYASASHDCSPLELDTATSLRILDELAEAKVPAVIFSGGEPMLRKDLLQLVQHATNVGVRPQLSSNGTLANDAAMTVLKQAGIGYFGVSIDGPPDFNDAFRGMHRGYERAIRGLESGVRAGVKTGLRMTVTKRNAGEVRTMAALAKRVGVDRFYVSHLIEVGRGGAVDACTPTRTRELLFDLFELALDELEAGSPVGFVTGGNDSAGPLFLRWLATRFDVDAVERVRALLAARGGNTSGVGLLCIDSEGDVHPDQFWRTETLGNLKEQSFGEILQNPMRAHLARRADWLTGRCGACSALGLCGGGHRERALALHGDVAAPDPSCVLTDAEVGWVPASPSQGVAS